MGGTCWIMKDTVSTYSSSVINSEWQRRNEAQYDSNLTHPWIGPMADCCIYGYKLSGCIKACGSLTVLAFISPFNFSS